MGNMISQGAENHIGCMKNTSKGHILKIILCNECEHVTDSIECYRFRDKHKLTKDFLNRMGD